MQTLWLIDGCKNIFHHKFSKAKFKYEKRAKISTELVCCVQAGLVYLLVRLGDRDWAGGCQHQQQQQQQQAALRGEGEGDVTNSHEEGHTSSQRMGGFADKNCSIVNF